MKTDEAIRILQNYIDESHSSHGYNNMQMATATLLLDTLNLRKPEPPPLSPELRNAVTAIEAEIEPNVQTMPFNDGLRTAVHIIKNMRWK